ncbi:MAG: hypothetical protein WEC83_02230 [Patescibacteria group bacterium]
MMAAMYQLTSGRSYVIELATPITQEAFPGVLPYDVIALDGKGLDVKDLRNQLTSFQQRPSGDLRLLLICNGQHLTEILQNTLLKTVEEPPSQGAVVIQSSSIDAFLPTLRSRLQRLPSTGERIRPSAPATLNIAELMSKDRADVIATLELAVLSLDLMTKEGVYQHQLLTATLRRLRQNVNVKLALDWLHLNSNLELGIE